MKFKLYIYPHAQPHWHDSQPWCADTIPFSSAGIAKHCYVVINPDRADYFWCGQIADKDAWQLHPNRYQYFAGNESRHIFDLEGDWRDQDHPDWLADAIITTGHVRLESRATFKRRFARPVMSPLLMRLVKNPPEYAPPEARGFWFQGQLDVTHKIREKVRQAFVMSGVPGEWQFNPDWSLNRGEDDPVVQDYLAKARKWSHALCPIGEGPSARLYEMALLERIPVLVGDYQPFGDNFVTLATTCPVESMAGMFSDLMSGYHLDEGIRSATRLTARRLTEYFADPTAYLLEWLRGR